ncbi:MAG: chemotaxis protein CheB [Deltaproteobacteria bacterium]
MSARIRTLVIDDSASVRRALVQILEQAEDVLIVGQASDGQEGLRLALELRPELILLDLEMPRMDGFTFLRFLKRQAPTRVLVLSRHSGRGDVRRALELGAAGFVPKPMRSLPPGAAELSELLRQIRGLGAPPAALAAPSSEPFRVVLLGASTGGPSAIARVLVDLPPDLPICVVIAQHMPARFTTSFAERLDRSSAFKVVEAQEGDRLAAGLALVAPGGKNLVLAGSALAPTAHLEEGAGHYVPSVDALFRSAAALLGSAAMGIVMTGMGQDGRAGLEALRAAGARTIAEAPETSVVFGMPKAAIESGAAAEVRSLPSIAQAVLDFGR